MPRRTGTSSFRATDFWDAGTAHEPEIEDRTHDSRVIPQPRELRVCSDHASVADDAVHSNGSPATEFPANRSFRSPRGRPSLGDEDTGDSNASNADQSNPCSIRSRHPPIFPYRSPSRPRTKAGTALGATSAKPLLKLKPTESNRPTSAKISDNSLQKIRIVGVMAQMTSHRQHENWEAIGASRHALCACRNRTRREQKNFYLNWL